MPLYVNVPNAPGVPAVAFAPFAPAALDLMTADGIGAFGGLLGPKWGIYLDGAPVVIADTVLAFDCRKEAIISDYPVEEGSFESYDKVSVPADMRFRFCCGTAANRQILLDCIDPLIYDLNLYDIVTADAVYSSYNIKHYDYRRTGTAGLGLLVVDVWAEEVRVATVDFGSTAAPSGAAQSNGGTVQGTAPTGAQQSAISNSVLSAGGGLAPDEQAALDAYNARHP